MFASAALHIPADTVEALEGRFYDAAFGLFFLILIFIFLPYTTTTLLFVYFFFSNMSTFDTLDINFGLSKHTLLEITQW